MWVKSMPDMGDTANLLDALQDLFGMVLETADDSASMAAIERETWLSSF